MMNPQKPYSPVPPAKTQMRPRPLPSGTPSPRASVLNGLKKPERKRYSTNLSEAAARAAVEQM